MLSHDTQVQLVKTIMTIAKEEQGLETIKQLLAEQKLFTPYTAFLRIDKLDHRHLTKTDLQSFLE